MRHKDGEHIMPPKAVQDTTEIVRIQINKQLYNRIQRTGTVGKSIPKPKGVDVRPHSKVLLVMEADPRITYEAWCHTVGLLRMHVALRSEIQ